MEDALMSARRRTLGPAAARLRFGVVLGLATALTAGAAEPAGAQSRLRFTPATLWHSDFTPQTTLVADVDADGKDDLVGVSTRHVFAQYYNVEVWVALSEGHRFAASKLWLRVLTTSSSVTPVTGDFDGDGRADLALMTPGVPGPTVGGNVWVYLSRPGSFVAAPSGWNSAFSLGPVTGSGSPVLRAADADGDGRADLVLFVRDSRSGSERGDVWVRRSTGSGFQAMGLWHDFFGVGAETPLLADVDGDGDDDAVVFVRDAYGGLDRGKVRVALSDDARFAPWTNWHNFFCIGNEVPGLGDFDGDGAADAVTFVQDTQGGSERGKVRVVLSQRTHFTGWTNWLDAFATDGALPLVGDFNGDGQADVASLAPAWRPEPQRGDAQVAVADTALTHEPHRVPTNPVMSLLASAHTGGVDGVYLKQVRGRVLAANDIQLVFDPASTLKVTVHLHAVLDLLNLNPATGQPYRRLADTVNIPANRTPGGCPIQDGVFVEKSLESALAATMERSTNEDPEGLRQIFGPANLDRTVAAVGLDSTRYLNPPGCGQNQASLEDLGRLYEAVSRGLLEHWRPEFDRLMIDLPIFEIQPILDAEIARWVLPAGFRSGYLDRVVNIYKPGNGGDATGQKASVAGLMSLPFCTAAGVAHRDYVYGVFFDRATAVNPDPSGIGPYNLNRVVAELFRQELAMSVYSFATGGCSV